MKKTTKRRNQGPGSLRIIAGEWRGSRLAIADLPGLRPSGDRCRETLFNWLQPWLRGAVCVDLFSGSGALGMEAASRGAALVILVEKERQAGTILQQNIERLKAENVQVEVTDAMLWLPGCEAQSLDLVFIDPPFDLKLERRALDLITLGDCVKTGGHVYLETATAAAKIDPGSAWNISREKVLGEVRMLLLKKL